MITINDIKELTKEKGFIYALCIIISEDYTVYIDEILKTDSSKLLNLK